MGNFVLTISKQWDQNITYLKKKLILEEDPSLRFIFSQVHSYKKVNVKVRLLKMDLEVGIRPDYKACADNYGYLVVCTVQRKT